MPLTHREEEKVLQIQEDVEMESEESPKPPKTQKKRSKSMKKDTKASLSLTASKKQEGAPDMSNLFKLVNALGGEHQERSTTRFAPTKPQKFRPNIKGSSTSKSL